MPDVGYRYTLVRRWGPGPPLLWIMLNPSTADHQVPDPTIKRVIGFSHRFGHRGCIVANLYALRATKPNALRDSPDPIGPKNDRWLRRLLRRHDRAVAAWGAWPHAQERSSQVRRMAVEEGCDLYALRLTKTECPGHPLYVRAETDLIEYPPPCTCLGSQQGPDYCMRHSA